MLLHRFYRLDWILLLTVWSLNACVPAVNESPKDQSFLPVFSPLLITPFRAQLDGLGIELDQSKSKVFSYGGEDFNHFQKMLIRLYEDHPGFCPAVNGFFADPLRPLYLTVLTREKEVIVFAYDQSQRPKLIYTIVRGTSKEVLERQSCPRK